MSPEGIVDGESARLKRIERLGYKKWLEGGKDRTGG